jgi:tripartite-type tricarboxylate transporter receptor subunit TctC
MRRSFLAAAALAALSVCGIGAAQAQDFPARPLRIVLPIPAGTALDVVTRLVAEQLSSRLGQQVVVENRPGAGGLIAAQAVATAPGDGYTLLGGASSIWTILPAQKSKLPFDVERDFTQVALISGATPMYVAVSPKLGIKSFAELAALARSKPGEIAIGTNGAGSLPHFAGLALAKRGNIPFNIVPYNQGGTVAAISDIMGGRIHATIEAVFGLRGPIQSGDIKLIGVMSTQADGLFPDVPVVAATVPGYSAVGFMSLAAPAGTSDRVVQRLNAAVRQALEAPLVAQRFAELGIPRQIMTPAETKAFVDAQAQYWWPLVREFEPN